MYTQTPPISPVMSSWTWEWDWDGCRFVRFCDILFLFWKGDGLISAALPVDVMQPVILHSLLEGSFVREAECLKE